MILTALLSVFTSLPSDSYDDYGDYSPFAGAAGAAFFIGYLIFIVVIGVGSYLLMALTTMRFFKRVGVESWVAWVPVYNTWKWLEVGGFNGALALLSLIPYGGIVTSIFLYIGMYRTGKAMYKQDSYVVLGIFLPFVWAYMMGNPANPYYPEVFAHFGWPAPRAGYITGTPFAPQQPAPSAPAV